LSREGLSEAVLLDTNALMAVGKLGVDLFDELDRVASRKEAVVPTGVVRELRGLAESGGAETRDASLALQLVEDLPRVETSGDVDDELVRLATEEGYEVVTNDGELIKRLKEKRVPVIYIRQKSYLQRSLD